MLERLGWGHIFKMRQYIAHFVGQSWVGRKNAEI